MIIQFFPNVRSITTLIYSVNSRGAIEIIPKASGISIYSPPTALSTHTLKDEYLQEESKYRTSGMRLLEEDDGYECLLIYSGIHGRYLQAGKADRDAYTGPNYIPPPKKNPPQPWSCKIKGTELTPIEICYPGVAIPKIYSGQTGRKNKDVVRAHEHTTSFSLEKVRAGLIRPCNDEKYVRESLILRKISWKQTVFQGQNFTSNICILEGGRGTGEDYHKTLTSLCEWIPEAHCSPEELFPSPENYNWEGIVPFSLVATPYIDEPVDDAIRVDVFEEKTALNITDERYGAKMLHAQMFTPNLTTKTTPWTGKYPSGFTEMHVHRIECCPDWLVVTYDPQKLIGESLYAKFADFEGYDDAEMRVLARPLCIVPVVVRFQPEPPYVGPLDHRTGRRLFYGHSLILYAVNSRSVYGDFTTIQPKISNITHPITKNPIFEGPVNLREHLGYPPPERVEEEVEEEKKDGRKIPINEREEEEIIRPEEEIPYEALQDRANMFLENFPVVLPEEGEEIARAALTDILDRADVQIVMENLLTAVDRSWENEVTATNLGFKTVRDWRAAWRNNPENKNKPIWTYFGIDTKEKWEKSHERKWVQKSARGEYFYSELKKERLEKMKKELLKKKKEEEERGEK